MKLSKRLEKILGLVSFGGPLLDIGTDHGFVPIAAVERNISSRAIGADISNESVMKASRLAEKKGLSDRVSFLFSDGFMRIPKSPLAYVIVISGLGGRSAAKILKDGVLCGYPLGKVSQIILSPQSEPSFLRRFIIEDLGFRIERESFVYEDGFYYIIMDVRPSRETESYTEEEYLYGKDIDPSSSEIYRDYLLHERYVLLANIEKAGKGSSASSNESLLELQNTLSLLRKRLRKG